MNNYLKKPLMVIGAGIAGITTALEAAEAGADVILVENFESIGGRVLRNHNYFPKMCPPSCGVEINTRRLERNPRIRVMTGATVTDAHAGDDGWSVKVTKKPAYVNSKCTACGDCQTVCPVKVKDPFNLEMGEITAIRLPNPEAWPHIFTISRQACPDGCDKCVNACEAKAIDLDAKPVTEDIEVSAVVIATGWSPYPLEKLEDLGGGVFEDVVSNVQLERLAASSGPTGGKILKPSNGEPPQNIAFVQCAGSRDVNHLAYCSAVCCMASFKQALYVNEQYPEAKVSVYYIDRRAPGRNEDMLVQAAGLKGVNMVKGKVGSIEKGENGNLSLKLEDVEKGRITQAEADLVVLATGMVPNKIENNPFNVEIDEDGFMLDNPEKNLFVAGVSKRPEDVASSTRDATGTAAKAIIAAARRA